MENTKEVFNQELLQAKKTEIGEVIRKYKNIKKMSNRMVDNYYKNKGVQNFNLGSTQYQRVVNEKNNYQINTLLKLLDILNLELVIRPKNKEVSINVK
jgi:hypothetical protein